MLSQASGRVEIAGNHDGFSAAGRGDLGGQRGQTIRPPRHERETVAVRCEGPREFGANSRRGTGN